MTPLPAPRTRLPGGPRGFSLLDVTVALAVVGVMASLALPPMQQQLDRARRSQAILALEQLQLTQETYRGHHGHYAPSLDGLSGVATAGEHYELSLAAAHATGYIARAVSRGAVRRDGGCAELTLTVADGAAAYGPSERCWNR